MKKIIITCLTAICFGNVFAQSTDEIDKQKFIFKKATNYNDPFIARMALYNILAENPGNIQVLDSLAVLYAQNSVWASAALVSQEVLKINNNDPVALQISAVSFENLGVKNRAIDNYETLYLKNNSLSTLYKISFLQYELKRYEESLTNCDVILENKKAEDIQLVFGKKDNTQQQVSMRAAAFRLKGMIEKERGNTEQAKKYYNQALEINSDFELAQDELNDLG